VEDRLELETHTHTTSRVSFKKKLREERKKVGLLLALEPASEIEQQPPAENGCFSFIFIFLSLLPCWLLLLLPGVVTHPTHTHTETIQQEREEVIWNPTL
jgi:hypothetical protein